MSESCLSPLLSKPLIATIPRRGEKGGAMKDSSFYTGRATPQVRADDVELDTLLRRAAEFLRSRRSPTDQQGMRRESPPTGDVVLKRE